MESLFTPPGAGDRYCAPASRQQLPRKAATAGQFETMILDNLEKGPGAEYQKSECLKFERLEPYAGEWLHAEGEYTDAKGGRFEGCRLSRPGGTVSHPFPRPATGKIAIKVINHYGDEVLKVFEVVMRGSKSRRRDAHSSRRAGER